MGYGHLSIDEREVILKMQGQEASLREIARYLGRSAGTISRELARNSGRTGNYRAHLAQRYYQNRRRASKEPYRLEEDRSLRAYVQARLKEYWSPEQISGRVTRAIRKHVSPVTIYSWVKRNKRKGGGFWTYLRQSHRRRRKRHGSIDRRGILPDRRMIGREFAGFKKLERGLGMQSYFAHPYHSRERGTNENTNGLLRQFFPKGMDFTQITESELDRMLALLNNRPRKCLNYRTPTEVFWKKPSVALQIEIFNFFLTKSGVNGNGS